MRLPQLRIGNLMPKFPIIQGGMAFRVSTAPLVSAVTNAGGIGVLGASGMSGDELREEIRKTRKMCSGPFGVNIMYAVKNFPQLVKTAIEEKIDVIFTGAGFSRDIFKWGKDSGVPVVSIVSSTKLAVIAQRLGAAAVVVEGKEAGGHLGTDRPLLELFPLIRKAVKIPLIAAGGIIDGKGMAKMFKLGADGVQMGTRFVLSKECDVSDAFKEMYLKAKEEDVILVPSPVGMPGRALRNVFAEKVMSGDKVKPPECRRCLKNCSTDYCIMKALDNSRLGNIDEGIVFAGKNVYKVKDILPVREIFDRLVKEVESIPD